MKPVINLGELELEHEARGPFEARWAAVSERIGAVHLGYNLTVVPPGKKAVPFHNHRNNEEMFLVLDGEGTLRFGDKEYPLRPRDVGAFPPGGREVAHQIINTGTRDLVYLALSTKDPIEICEYPDSNKILANDSRDGHDGKPSLRQMFRAGDVVDYWDGETR